MIKLVIVVGAGGYAAARPKGRPLLSRGSIQDLSRLSATVLIPCLIVASIGSSVSVKLLKSSAVVAAFGLITVAFGAAAMRLATSSSGAIFASSLRALLLLKKAMTEHLTRPEHSKKVSLQ